MSTKLSPSLWPALIDPAQIEHVILNLAINARDAMPDGGTLTITTANATLGRSEELAPGDYVVIAVSDTGTGMTEEILRNAFEPFFTTKQPGQGSGLGLSQVHGMASQSGGGVRNRQHGWQRHHSQRVFSACGCRRDDGFGRRCEA